MSEWGEWNEVRLLVKELITAQEKKTDKMQENITWLVRAVIGALLGIMVNAILNLISLKGGG